EPATVTVTGAGGLSLTPSAVTADTSDARTDNATYAHAESANHLASSDSEDFTIGKAASVTTVTITGAPFTYTGSAIEPATVTVKIGRASCRERAAIYAGEAKAGKANASSSYGESANAV